VRGEFECVDQCGECVCLVVSVVRVHHDGTDSTSGAYRMPRVYGQVGLGAEEQHSAADDPAQDSGDDQVSAYPFVQRNNVGADRRQTWRQISPIEHTWPCLGYGKRMERMVHYIGGPVDGLTQVVPESRHPTVLEVSGHTDGFYTMRYNVAGQRLGPLVLTADDAVAEWHQRRSPTDFTSGDRVIVIANDQHGVLVGPHTTVYEGGETDEGWLVRINNRLVTLKPEEIRIATPAEIDRTGDDNP